MRKRALFTGAEECRKGIFEMADGGTLLLDEIGEMPLHLQAKLLNVLEERQLRRLGGSRQIPVDVRIIAATNSDLEVAVRNHAFREDLYFRLERIAPASATVTREASGYPRTVPSFS